MKAILVILLAFSLVAVGVGYNLPASSIQGNLNMTDHNVIGLATPTNDTDAATKAYADAVAVGGGLPTTGGVMTGQIDFGGFTAYNSTAPVNDTDLSTKKYIDDAIVDIHTDFALTNKSGIYASSCGAVGNGTADDTAALQLTMTYAVANKTRAIFTGISGNNFHITDELIIPSGTVDNIVIDGLSSGCNILADLDFGEFAITDNGSQIGGVVVQNLDVVPYGTNYNGGGIEITSSLRGVELSNVRVYGLQRGINLTGDIWGYTLLKGVGCYLSELSNSTGLVVYGNAVFCYGLEIIGYNQGLRWEGGNLGGIWGGNIAGSDGYTTDEAVVIDNVSNIVIDSVWLEELNETKYGAGKAKAIDITDGNNIRLQNIRFSSGCLYVNGGSTVEMDDNSFYQENGDGGYGKIIVADGGYLSSRNTRFVSGSFGHATLNQGNISDDSYTSFGGSSGRFYLPRLDSDLVWIFETNNGLVDLQYDTSDFLTGNKSANVTTAEWQGIYFNATGLPKDLPCTVVAVVKCDTDNAMIYITSVGSTSTSEDYTGPAQSLCNAGDNWRRISSTLRTSNGQIDAKIISNTSAIFKVDSINVYAGVVDYMPY